MKLKILVVPTLIAAIVITIIWVIVPEVKDVLDKKKQLEEKTLKLSEIEEKNRKARKLGEYLGGNTVQNRILADYIPQEKKEEEIISTLQYLAKQEDLLIYSLNIKQNQDGKTNNAQSQISAASSAGENGDEKNAAQARDLEIIVKTIGQYEKITVFLKKISNLERYNRAEYVKISKVNSGSEQEGGEEIKRISALDMEIGLNFKYVEKSDALVVSADNSIFSREEFEVDVIKAIQEKMKTAVMEPVADKSGRSNPFF